MSESSLANWNRTRLDQVIDQFIVPMRDKPPAWTGDIPWCRIEDFDGKYLYGSKSHQYVDSNMVKLMNLKVYPTGTLLCSCSATLGICTITARPLVSNQTFIGLVPMRTVNTEFLYYKMTSLAGVLQGMSSGTTIAYLPRSKFESLEIELPPREQQNRIAEILSTLDEAIAQTEALIAKHQQIKAGLMHDLFTRGVTPDGHLRPTREQAPDLYKESPLGWIPQEWDVRQLGEIAEVNRGKFTIRPRNDPRFYGGEYPFIQTGDVSLANGRVLSTFSQTLNQSGLAVSRLFDKGTIMVTIAANIADTCVLGLPMCAPDSLVGVLPNKGQVSRFLQLCISRRKSWLEARAPQTAQKNINLEDLRPLLIPMPCQHEQEAIAAIYESADFSLVASEQMVEKLHKQKHGLMHDLLTGRVRVLPHPGPLPAGEGENREEPAHA